APDPRRAAALARVVEGHGRLVLGECWPDLSLVACWLGGSAGIQARHLDAHIGPRVARRDLGLVASEGRLTIPVDDHSAAGVLAVHATFFEFVPEEAIEEPAPHPLLAHELELGRRYYAIVSGGNGDVNIEYASKRASARLHRPRLFVMRAGWSERLCRADFARGRREAQHKWSSIVPEWDAASRGEVQQRIDEPVEIPS